MLQHKIELPAEAKEHLEKLLNQMTTGIVSNEHGDFRAMVTSLFKAMNTQADALHHAGTGISTEAGEILDITKKVWVYNKDLDAKHMIEELSDLRFYYEAMLILLGISDLHVQAYNMDKLVLGENARFKTWAYSDADANARRDKVATGETANSGVADHLIPPPAAERPWPNPAHAPAPFDDGTRHQGHHHHDTGSHHGDSGSDNSGGGAE